MIGINQSTLDFVACDLCGGTNTRDVVTRPDGLRAVECVNCGLCYLNPRPKTELIKNLYNGGYFRKETRAREPSYGFNEYLGATNQTLLKQSAQARLRLLSPYLDVRGKHCLEIGCATGEFSALLQQNATVVGIELAEEAIALAKQRYPGVDFRQGDLSALREQELFEAIFAFEVIEHVESPAEFLQDLSLRLKSGGVIIITTPNINCGKRVGVDVWSGFQSSLEHLYFFNSEAVTSLASKAGLTVVKKLTGCGDGIQKEPMVDGKEPLRRILRQLGLMNLVSQYRSARNENAPDAKYLERDDLHNLFMVLAKA